MKNPVHVHIEYSEAVSAKRNVLESKVDLLEIIKNIKGYKRLRKQELFLKSRLKAMSKEMAEAISQIEQKLPSLEGSEKSLLGRAIKAEIKINEGAGRTGRKKPAEEQSGIASIDSEIINIKKQLEALE